MARPIHHQVIAPTKGDLWPQSVLWRQPYLVELILSEEGRFAGNVEPETLNLATADNRVETILISLLVTLPILAALLASRFVYSRITEAVNDGDRRRRLAVYHEVLNDLSFIHDDTKSRLPTELDPVESGVTFVITDIESSTAAAAADPVAMQRVHSAQLLNRCCSRTAAKLGCVGTVQVQTIHDLVMRELIIKYSGYEISTQVCCRSTACASTTVACAIL